MFRLVGALDHCLFLLLLSAVHFMAGCVVRHRCSIGLCVFDLPKQLAFPLTLLTPPRLMYSRNLIRAFNLIVSGCHGEGAVLFSPASSDAHARAHTHNHTFTAASAARLSGAAAPFEFAPPPYGSA